jgi:uncharacterized protein YegP (UPF0339 family)
MYTIMNPSKNEYVVEIWKAMSGMWYWHVMHRNGKIICTSEGYTRRNRALKSAQKLTLNVANATFKIIEPK